MADRNALLGSLRTGGPFDLLVIGGGATGCGVALDAASRGHRVALVEKGDFAEGTSGRSTKLVHGGVRYLEMAVLHLDRSQFDLVRDALHERAVLMRVAPHLVRPITLAMPLYGLWRIPYVLAGLALYDLLAGAAGLGHSRFVGRREMRRRYPLVREAGLRGGVLYRDGQFEDARMNVAIALTAIHHGATVVNHVEATRLVKREGRLAGAVVQDSLTGETFEVRVRGVINATGPHADAVRRMDDAAAPPMLRVSAGAHIVLDRRFPPPEAGLTIPKTEDGRLLFVLPWRGRCLVGTTEAPPEAADRPRATESDLAYLLRHLRRHFDMEVTREDVSASWAGLRPLVADERTCDTARLSRDHALSLSASGLLTIAGGKWTTYRRMAQDTVDYAQRAMGLTPAGPCRTEQILLEGASGFAPESARSLAGDFGLDEAAARHLNDTYGSRGPEVARLATGELREPLAEGFPFLKAEVIYAARREMAARAADVLCRRLPLAAIDAAAARAAAPWVLQALAVEAGWSPRRLASERDDLEGRLGGTL